MSLAATITKKRATELAEKLHVNLRRVDIVWWKAGIVSELQNLALVQQAAGYDLATDDMPLDMLAARVAFDKMQLFPDWYQRLKTTEDEAIVHWRNIQVAK